MTKKRVILLSITFIIILLLIYNCKKSYIAGKQRYEINNFFQNNVLTADTGIVFPLDNKICQIYSTETFDQQIYEKYQGNQLEANFALNTKTITHLFINEKAIIITPGYDKTALTYDLDSFQLTDKQAMVGERLLGRLEDCYVYFSENWNNNGKGCFLLADEKGEVTNLTNSVTEAFLSNEVVKIKETNYFIYETEEWVCIGKGSDEKNYVNLYCLYQKENPKNEIPLTYASNGKHVAVDTEKNRYFLYQNNQQVLECLDNGIYREIPLPDIEEYEKDAINITFKEGKFYFLIQKTKAPSQIWGPYNLNQANLLQEAVYVYDTDTETGKFLYETRSRRERIVGCTNEQLYLLDTRTGKIYKMNENGKIHITTIPTEYPCMYATSFDGKTVIYGEKKYDSGKQDILTVL